MSSAAEAWRRLEAFLTSGIAGSQFTPLRLLTVIALISVLIWLTQRVTRWLIDHVLAAAASTSECARLSERLFDTSSSAWASW